VTALVMTTKVIMSVTKIDNDCADDDYASDDNNCDFIDEEDTDNCAGDGN
jgi:hypothetical protein